MVATSIHYLIGVFIAWLFGCKDNKKYTFGLWAALPDIDGIIIAVLMLGKTLFGYSIAFLEENQLFVTLFAHRGLSHSLLLLVLLIFLLRRSKRIYMIATMFASHLFLDFITAWKLFPLLPFSYQPMQIGLVEVFDSVLVFLTMILFGLFVSQSLAKKEKKLPLVLSYIFVIMMGFIPSVMMQEFNIQTIVLSQLFFWGIILYHSIRKNTKQYSRVIISVFAIIVLYVVMLFLVKMHYAAVLDASLTNIEPLEEFAFNYNAHTFEILHEDMFHIGIITLQGIEKEQRILRIRDESNVLTQSIVNEYEAAYKKALHVNWFNQPVWTFYQDETGTIYANIRYAKSFLDTPYIPGPRNGLNVTLQNGMLVGYGDRWFD